MFHNGVEFHSVVTCRDRTDMVLGRKHRTSRYLREYNALHYESDMQKLEWCRSHGKPISVAEYDRRHKRKPLKAPHHCEHCRHEVTVWCGRCGRCMNCCECLDDENEE